MNLQTTNPSKKAPQTVDLDLEEFDFKPITSGLGFNHQPKTTEIKPAFIERPVVRETPVVRTQPALKKEMNVYQNDLSIFYGQTETMKPMVQPEAEVKPEKTYRLASKVDRVVAYTLDVSLIVSVLSLMLMMMARAMDMEIMDAWSMYPNEVTPLVATLFCGFYLLYFAISEKSGSTLGKSMMNLRVVDADYKKQNLVILLVRSMITLLNFASLGLFSYFDLQNKATGSKVIKAD